jgi:hypothetical protein
MPTKLNVFRALLLATAVVQSVCATANAGEKAAAIYRSRYMLAGFLVRAAAVCGDNKKSFKRFVDAVTWCSRHPGAQGVIESLS